jgi:hypothetical protein
MKTQKQLLEEHRRELDLKFHERYPNGQFVLQIKPEGTKRPITKTHYTIYGMYWNPKRRTSGGSSARGLSVYYYEKDGKVTIEVGEYQNSSFGKCYYYDNFNDFIRSARYKGFPKRVVSTFILKFSHRPLNKGD